MGVRLAYTTGADELVEVTQREDHSILSLPERPATLRLIDGPIGARIAGWAVIAALSWLVWAFVRPVFLSIFRMPTVGLGVRVIFLIVLGLALSLIGAMVLGAVFLMLPQRHRIEVHRDHIRFRSGWFRPRVEFEELRAILIQGRAGSQPQELERPSQVYVVLWWQQRRLAGEVPLYLARELTKVLGQEMVRLSATRPIVFDVTNGFGAALPQISESRCTLKVQDGSRLVEIRDEKRPFPWMQVRIMAYVIAGLLGVCLMLRMLGAPLSIPREFILFLTGWAALGCFAQLLMVLRRTSPRLVVIMPNELQVQCSSLLGKRTIKHPLEAIAALDVRRKEDGNWARPVLEVITKDARSVSLVKAHLLVVAELGGILSRELGVPWHRPAKAASNPMYGPWHYENGDEPAKCRIQIERRDGISTIRLPPLWWCNSTKAMMGIGFGLLLCGALLIPVVMPYMTVREQRSTALFVAIVCAILGLAGLFAAAEGLVESWAVAITDENVRIDRRTVLGTKQQALKRSEIAAVHTDAPTIAVIIHVVVETWSGNRQRIFHDTNPAVARYVATLLRKELGVGSRVGSMTNGETENDESTRLTSASSVEPELAAVYFAD